MRRKKRRNTTVIVTIVFTLGAIVGYSLELEDIQVNETVSVDGIGLERSDTEESYEIWNDNIPTFDTSSFDSYEVEVYEDLDALGRAVYTYAIVSTDTMPTEERESIGMIRPSGWHTVRYDDLIEDKYLYNRCHLIAYALTGQNANEKNLITGTRYLNIEGMLPWEIKVIEYIENTGNHVAYQVIPVFEGDNLVASGVNMQAYSIEDGGKGLCFNVYCYNIQPGITIDYATGDSWVSLD